MLIYGILAMILHSIIRWLTVRLYRLDVELHDAAVRRDTQPSATSGDRACACASGVPGV